MAECVRLVTVNTARLVPEGQYMPKRLGEILDPKPGDNRSSDEIIDHIKSKLRGLDKEGAQE